jgi:hypothetical protein
LAAGVVSLFGTSDKVSITTPDGKTVQLSAGESVAASGKLQDDDDDDDGGSAWWLYALIFGGAAGGILWAALSDNDVSIGTGGTVVSPTR